MTRTNQPPLAHFEECLLAELKHEVAARQPVPHREKSRPRRRIAIGTTVGLSAAVAAGLVVATTSAPSGTPKVTYSLAADFLNHAADVVRSQDPSLPTADQVQYTKELTVSPGPHGGINQCVVTWAPSPLTGLQNALGAGKCGPGVPPLPSAITMILQARPGASYSYPALNTLPTSSPAALRTALYAAADRGGAEWGLPTVHSANVIVSFMIERLLAVPLSGPLRATLYELLAKMPGITLVRNAVDAAGRHGTGVVMKWGYLGYGQGTFEVIFAPGTYTVLGGNNIMPGQRVYYAILGTGLVTLPKS
jgi:hypothetical protein